MCIFLFTEETARTLVNVLMSHCLLKCRSLCTNQSQTVIPKLMRISVATKGLRKRGWQESNITNSQHKISGATVECNKSRLFNCISGTIAFPPNHSASCCLHNNVFIKTKQNTFSVAAVLHVEEGNAVPLRTSTLQIQCSNLEKEQVKKKSSQVQWF